MEDDQSEVLSCDARHLDVHKKVHWALNLEEIFYFAPDTDCKAQHSMLKKLKTKVRALKNNHFSSLLEIRDRYRLYKMSEKFERLVEKLSGNCDELTKEHLNNLNKYWDELFELYGE